MPKNENKMMTPDMGKEALPAESDAPREAPFGIDDEEEPMRRGPDPVEAHPLQGGGLG